jgi:hypothetical protein
MIGGFYKRFRDRADLSEGPLNLRFYILTLSQIRKQEQLLGKFCI